MRISTYLNITILFLIYSCTTNKDSENSSQYKKYLKESISISLDSVSTYQFNWIQVIEDENDRELLINLNKIYNSLDFYDLGNKKLEKRISINDLSLDTRFIAHSFFYHNEDSIFIFPQYNFNGTLLINNVGKKVDEKGKIYDVLEEAQEGQYILNHITSPSNPSLYRDGNIYFSTIQMYVDIYNPLPKDVITNFKWDLKSDTISPISDTIYIYNSNNILISKRLCGTPDFQGFVELPPGNPFNEQYKFVVSQNSYARLLYDKYRDVYYRFFIIQRNLTEEDRSTKDNSKNKFAVLVYDNNFNLIKQVEFPSNKYFHYSSFVAIDGLYIPLTNKDYEGLSDEYVQYDIFEF